MDERRAAICEAVLDLAAAGGNRAISHGAVDRRLELPKGSASYYYRTRAALLTAAIEHLRERSRAEFEKVVPRTVEPDDATDVMAHQLHLLLTVRRRDALARYALAPDAAAEGLAEPLATCLFSVPLATELFRGLGATDPVSAARDLISLLEGLLFDRLYGARSLAAPRSDEESLADLRGPIRRAIDCAP
ncbi:TetR/AcrR family transcriptional regulator [Tsukamurella pseudospumae]|uniref:TetR family transcriptional regulator n=1 Tax=Tsukamurella pseudospumae TaxID=239498 RepID=A0A137ZIE1_9ACTN|nr:TetR/AcrR family transcriptional regulator [Tsukamurella pseudospumae]KXO97959.1 TetR family transcriptional regulator [Tsukamurella pseudospumae]